MRRRTLLLASVLASASIAACVGDEPSGDSGGDGGQSDATTTDGGGGADGSTDGNTGGGDSGADAGFPATLPGLVLWLEGDSLTLPDGHAITTWSDQSSHHNDATGNSVTLVRNSPAFNGHSAVHFAGQASYQDLLIPDPADNSLRLESDGFLIEIVERHPVLPFTTYVLYSKHHDKSAPGLQIYMTGNSGVTDAGAVGAELTYGTEYPEVLSPDVLANGVVNRIVFRFDPYTGNDGGKMSLSIAGGGLFQSNANSPPDIGGVGMPLVIGAHQTPDSGLVEAFQGDIAAIIVVKGPVSDTDQNSLDDYLKARYGL